MWNPNAGHPGHPGYPGPSPYPPHGGCPGSNPACPPSVNPAFPPGSCPPPPGVPRGIQLSPHVSRLILYHSQDVQDTNLQVLTLPPYPPPGPGMCPVNPLAPGMGSGMVTDKKMRKKMKKAHKRCTNNTSMASIPPLPRPLPAATLTEWGPGPSSQVSAVLLSHQALAVISLPGKLALCSLPLSYLCLPLLLSPVWLGRLRRRPPWASKVPLLDRAEELAGELSFEAG